MTDTPAGGREPAEDATPHLDPEPQPGPESGPESEPEAEPEAEPEPEAVMDLLAEHVPLTLLVDLATPQGPASEEILRTEGMPEDAWWEPETPEGPGARRS